MEIDPALVASIAGTVAGEYLFSRTDYLQVSADRFNQIELGSAGALGAERACVADRPRHVESAGAVV